MRKLASVLGLFAALCATWPAAAQTQFPATLPANTVWGRTGIGAGPGQAIPIQSFIGLMGGVPNSNLANMAADTVKCNPTAITGAPQDCTIQQAQVINGQQCLNITSSQFGGSGNNSTANDTPYANALAALTGNGGCIYFPPGKYRFTTNPSFSLPAGVFSVTLLGSGQDNTILTWPNASGGLTFNFSSPNHSAHFRDLSLTTTQVGGGNAISLVGTAAAIPTGQPTALSDFYRVTMRGDDGYGATDFWNVGLSSVGVSNVNTDGLYVQGPSTANGTGISFSGLPGSSLFAVVLNVAKSTFNLVTNGIIYGNFVQGITVDQSNFTGIQNGIASAGSDTGLAQLTVTNSQFNTGGTTGGFAIHTSTQVDGMQLIGNYFLVNGTTPTGVGGLCSFCIINDNVFWSSQGSVASAVGINLPTVSVAANIEGNHFRQFNGTSAIALEVGGGNSYIQGNTFSVNTTNITLGGTNNTGTDIPAQTYTPTPTCGTATFTVNAAKYTNAGKMTLVELDATITALGTCTNTTTFTLPTTSVTSGVISGINTVTNTFDFCLLGSSATATCHHTAGANYANGDHMVVSGAYSNQ